MGSPGPPGSSGPRRRGWPGPPARGCPCCRGGSSRWPRARPRWARARPPSGTGGPPRRGGPCSGTGWTMTWPRSCARPWPGSAGGSSSGPPARWRPIPAGPVRSPRSPRWAPAMSGPRRCAAAGRRPSRWTRWRGSTACGLPPEALELGVLLQPEIRPVAGGVARVTPAAHAAGAEVTVEGVLGHPGALLSGWAEGASAVVRLPVAPDDAAPLPGRLTRRGQASPARPGGPVRSPGPGR